MKIQHSNLIFTNCGRRVRALYQSSHSEQIKSGPGDHKKYSDKGESRKGWRERPLVVIYSTRSCPPRQDAVCVCGESCPNMWWLCHRHLLPPSFNIHLLRCAIKLVDFRFCFAQEQCVSKIQSESQIKVGTNSYKNTFQH